MGEIHRGTSVEVSARLDPIGRMGVLLQLEDGFVLMQPDDAEKVAGMINDVVREIRTAGR